MKWLQSKVVVLLAALFSIGICFISDNDTTINASSPQNTSTVVTNTVYSKQLGMDWNYDVYLPARYSQKATKRYPVLYMLHGLYGNHTNFLELVNSKKMLDNTIDHTKQPMIVVFVDGFNSFYVNQKGGQQMEKAVVKDLVPAMNKRYKIARGASKHAIGGISMGGYGAARFALKYPKLFSKAEMISPSVWYDLPANDPIRENMHAFTNGKAHWSSKVYNGLFPTKYMNKKSKHVKLYVESTSADTPVPIKDVDRFVKVAKRKGISTKFITDSGDNHNWTYWNKAMPKGYNWVAEEMK